MNIKYAQSGQLYILIFKSWTIGNKVAYEPFYLPFGENECVCT